MGKIQTWSEHIINHFWHCVSICKSTATTSDEKALKVMKMMLLSFMVEFLDFPQNSQYTKTMWMVIFVRHESNTCPPRHWVGAVSTELQPMESKVIWLRARSFMTGVQRTARTSTVHIYTFFTDTSAIKNLIHLNCITFFLGHLDWGIASCVQWA